MSARTDLINRISEISDNYDVVLLSYNGVIADGKIPYPFAIETLERLKREGKVVFIIENSSLRIQKMIEMLNENGINQDLYDGILTSGEVAYFEMASKKSDFFKNLGVCYYYIGRQEQINDWVEIGYIPVQSLSDAEFVITASSEYEQDTIERYLPQLRKAADINLPMLCINPDKSLGLPEGDDVGAGSIASRYEAVGGVVHYRGKPQNDIFEYCLEAFPDLDKNRVLVIGNSYLSDIKAAAELGLNSVLIAGGSHARELGVTLGKPLSLQIVDELSRHYGFFPNYVISGFKY